MFIPVSDDNPLRFIRRPYVTYAIILILLLFYAPILLNPDGQLTKEFFYGFGIIPSVVFGYNSVATEYINIPHDMTVISYIFIHANAAHIMGNLAFMFVFGDNIEDALGHMRFALFFLLTGIAGGVCHMFMNPTSVIPLVGASGAVSGMVVAYLFLFPFVKTWGIVLSWLPLKIPTFFFLLAWILYQIIAVKFLSESNVGWWAHLGGIFSGMILVILLKRKEIKLFSRQLPVLKFPKHTITEELEGELTQRQDKHLE